MAQKPIFSVVEELKNIHLKDFIDEIYNPEFWLSYIPLAAKEIRKSGDLIFEYSVADTIYMDPTRTLKYDFKSNGRIEIEDKGNQGEKGRLWILKVDVEHPEANIVVNIRAKDTNKGLKTGFFIHELHYNLGALEKVPFGEDAIIFAARLKLREMIQIFGKDFKH